MQGLGICRGARASHGGSGSPEVWAVERASFLVDVILEGDVTPPGRRVRGCRKACAKPNRAADKPLAGLHPPVVRPVRDGRGTRQSSKQAGTRWVCRA